MKKVHEMIILLKELNGNVNALCISSTLISTSSASRAISAVAEILAIITYDVAQQNSVSDKRNNCYAQIAGLWTFCPVMRKVANNAQTYARA